MADGNCLYNAWSMAFTEIHVCRLFYDTYQVLSCMKILNTMVSHPTIKLMHEKGAFTSIKNAFAICLSDFALSIFESQGLVAAVIEEAQLNAQNFTFSCMIFHLLSHTTLSAKICHR